MIVVWGVEEGEQGGLHPKRSVVEEETLQNVERVKVKELYYIKTKSIDR